MTKRAKSDRRALCTRATALANGWRYYFTGKPCKWGHVVSRDAITYECVECRRGYRQKTQAAVKALRQTIQRKT